LALLGLLLYVCRQLTVSLHSPISALLLIAACALQHPGYDRRRDLPCPAYARAFGVEALLACRVSPRRCDAPPVLVGAPPRRLLWS
jgi:hypothetical protein